MTWRSFRADYNVDELTRRFEFENECIENNRPIKGKNFFKELRLQLEEVKNG
jgi:hypothetical protein|nr:MAG TPA: hypothetical protein [Caudoviricetes sp.]